METNKGISARIKFVHVKGAELAYFYEKKLLDKLGLIPDTFDPNQTFMNVGETITLFEKKYKIVNILTKFFKEEYEDYMNYGVNVSGVGEQLPFNFQITYELDDSL